jgi:hypothetical protein
MSTQAPDVRQQYNTKCAEAVNGDLSTWRNVGRGIYDYHVSGNFRAVAVKDEDDFDLKAIYKHANRGGKTKVVGAIVVGY